MERASTEMGTGHSLQTVRCDYLDVQGYDTRGPRQRRPGGDFCPTPEEIAAECRRIQSEWSDRERWRRAGFSEGRPVWEVPVHQLASLSPA